MSITVEEGGRGLPCEYDLALGASDSVFDELSSYPSSNGSLVGLDKDVWGFEEPIRLIANAMAEGKECDSKQQ